MRKLIYYVACTVDGFIARRDGRFDFFLAEGEHFAALVDSFPETVPANMRDALGVSAPNKWFDAVVMGRNTYEVGTKIGITNPYPTLKQYVFSRSMKESPDPNVALVSEDAVGAIRRLKQEAGKDIWLCGGGDLAAALLTEIDELFLKVNPVLLGSGIQLFSGVAKPTGLELIDSRIFGNGVMFVHHHLKH
jgi:dihydrofolate reductase